MLLKMNDLIQVNPALYCEILSALLLDMEIVVAFQNGMLIG